MYESQSDQQRHYQDQDAAKSQSPGPQQQSTPDNPFYFQELDQIIKNSQEITGEYDQVQQNIMQELTSQAIKPAPISPIRQLRNIEPN